MPSILTSTVIGKNDDRSNITKALMLTSLFGGGTSDKLAFLVYQSRMARQFLAAPTGQWRSTTPFDDVTKSDSDDEDDSDLMNEWMNE